MKLAIVGAEAHTRHLAPWKDPSYEILVFNEFANADWCERWDMVLQLHSPSIYTDPNNDKDPHHWEWLQKKHGKPIWMQEIDPRIPDSVKYPLDGVLKLAKTLTHEGNPQRYLRASIAYAIALGIHQGYEGIDIWGVELAHSAEYRSQQNNFAFWVGVATGKGVPVNLHCCHGMFDKPLYGYEEFVQEDKIQRYLEGINIQIAEETEKLHKLEGARMLAIQMLTEAQKEAESAENATPKEKDKVSGNSRNGSKPASAAG